MPFSRARELNNLFPWYIGLLAPLLYLVVEMNEKEVSIMAF